MGGLRHLTFYHGADHLFATAYGVDADAQLSADSWLKSAVLRVDLTIDGAEPVPVPIDASGSGSATLKAGQKAPIIAYDERPRNG